MQETVAQYSVLWEERPFLTSWKLQGQAKEKGKVKTMKTKEVMSGKNSVKISNVAGPGTPQGYETKIPWVKTLSP